ncbi:MAG: hypothetical protein KGJ93_00805 [Patescibacteria group bacterium]|nr:hypothetical protein [Patescibacteria group bacterium]
MKIKIIILGLATALLSAGCNMFSTPAAAGVVKTVNGGADWQFSNVLKGGSANIGQLNIAKLDFDPSNRETVFVGSYSGGLYKSEDSGASWTNILSKIAIYDFAINSGDPKIIYAAGIYASQGKVLKSVDGGASWQQVYNDAGQNNAVRVVALNPQAPQQLIIGTNSGSLIKSADGGQTWQLMANFSDPVMRVFWQPNAVLVLLKTKGLFSGGFASAQAGDFQELTKSIVKTSPTDYLYTEPFAFNQGFVDSVTGSLIYLTTSRGLYKSTDGGQTWNQLALPVKQTESNARAITIARTSSNLVFTSVGSVIYKSTDGGASWQTQNIPTSGFINYILTDPQLPQIAYAGIYVPAQ